MRTSDTPLLCRERSTDISSCCAKGSTVYHEHMTAFGLVAQTAEGPKWALSRPAGLRDPNGGVQQKLPLTSTTPNVFSWVGSRQLP